MHQRRQHDDKPHVSNSAHSNAISLLHMQGLGQRDRPIGAWDELAIVPDLDMLVHVQLMWCVVSTGVCRM